METDNKEKIVLFDKKKLMEKVESFELRKEILVPELSAFLNLPEDECKLIVRGASLEDHIRAADISESHIKLISNALKIMSTGKDVSVDSLKEGFLQQVNNKIAFDIIIFQRCVEEPFFELDEVVKLSSVVPGFVNKIAKIALGITDMEKTNVN